MEVMGGAAYRINCIAPSGTAEISKMNPMIEGWIDQTERRTRFLSEIVNSL